MRVKEGGMENGGNVMGKMGGRKEGLDRTAYCQVKALAILLVWEVSPFPSLLSPPLIQLGVCEKKTTLAAEPTGQSRQVPANFLLLMAGQAILLSQ